MQYDAHECLIQLLEKIYPNIGNNCMFKVGTLETTVCQNCGHSIDKSETCNHISLNLEDTNNLQTVSGILNMVMDPHGKLLLDYRCDNCHSICSCTKAYCVTDISDVLIIQLVIFKFTNGRIKKVIPSVH